MEEMLGEVKRPAICLRTMLDDFKTQLENDDKPQSRNDIASAMNLLSDSNRFQETEEKCSLEHLQQIDDVRVTAYIPGFTEPNRRTVTKIPQEAFDLKTFAELIKIKQSTVKNPFDRTRYSFKPVQMPTIDKSSEPPHRAPFTDLLIYVRIYRPARATHIGQSLEKPVFAEEFQCLGSNLLTELRDKISCVCKRKRFFEISDHPNEEQQNKETDPGFFFITDTFYNDQRNPANADYSETIREWAKRAKGLQYLQFKVAKMEETRFIDLTVNLGFPQLYEHHGNCEHVFVFSQIQVITPSVFKTLAAPSQYPLLTSFSTFNNRLCNMCGQRSYVFIVEQSDRQLHDPAYLCNKCFFGFHYIDGKKIGKFKAYKVNDYEEDEPLNDEEEEEEMDTAETLDVTDNFTAEDSSSINDTLTQQCENNFAAESETDEREFESIVTVKSERAD